MEEPNNGLPALYEGRLEDEFGRLITRYSGFSSWQVPRRWPDLPQREPIFSRFKPTRVIKKGQAGKDKSVRGYIWVDTDPVAILLNKYVVRSCHTIDNKQGYQGGNFTHLYCPDLATMFAGPYRPSRKFETDAKSPASNIALEREDGEVFRIRKHAAVANVLFMRSRESGLPYLFLGRLYDSCFENPWRDTALRYFAVRCERAGIGLAVGGTYLDDGESMTIKGRHFTGYSSRTELATSRFSLPVCGNAPILYCDDEVDLIVFEDGTAAYEAEARVVLPPKIITGPLVHVPDTEGRPSTNDLLRALGRGCCAFCGKADRGDAFMGEPGAFRPDGHRGHVCDACYLSRRRICPDCKRESVRFRDLPSGQICLDCWVRDAYHCAVCDERKHPQEPGGELRSQFLHTVAIEHVFLVCKACEDRTSRHRGKCLCCGDFRYDDRFEDTLCFRCYDGRVDRFGNVHMRDEDMPDYRRQLLNLKKTGRFTNAKGREVVTDYAAAIEGGRSTAAASASSTEADLTNDGQSLATIQLVTVDESQPMAVSIWDEWASGADHRVYRVETLEHSRFRAMYFCQPTEPETGD